MAYNYNKLKGRIKELFGTQEAFAKRLGMSSVSLSARLNNKNDWTQGEIYEASDALGVLGKPEEVISLFFTQAS